MINKIKISSLSNFYIIRIDLNIYDSTINYIRLGNK